jgi:hypothetical protein
MKYTGNCHCKNVTYEVELDLSGGVLNCNCSFCEAKGLLLAFAPKEKLSISSGGEVLVTYKFNKHVLEHMFCKDCGVQPFSFGINPSGVSTAAVNVRTLNGVDIESLKKNFYDGKSL